jgi:hypothetical protein
MALLYSLYKLPPAEILYHIHFVFPIDVYPALFMESIFIC